MIVLIEAEQGKITSDMSFAGYMGAKSDSDAEIKTTSINGLSIALIGLNKEDVLPVGSVDFIKKVCEIMEVELPEPLNIPALLIPDLGRKVWTQRKSELESFPCFVKPLEEVKLFTGFVVQSKSDLDNNFEMKDWNGMLFCSELIGNIISEWRCYILNGKVLNCSCYRGDPLFFPDREKILELMSKFENSPAGYSLDVAVTVKGSELIECNDAWALGYYGGEFSDYYKMVKARWLEIINN
ncbi:MAG: hypothetical protein JWO03_4028 [Bacteroidetes bacterium]|nr:hypothetical protein [Bacteroidota bacterium]